MPADIDEVREAVTQLVAAVRDDPKLKEAVSADPVGTLRARVPEITAPMGPDEIRAFAGHVLAGSEVFKTPLGAKAIRGSFLCPACRATLFALLAAAGIAAIIATGATGGALAASIIAAAVPVLVAATGMTAAAATAVIQSSFATLGLSSAKAILDGIADGACKKMGC